MKKHNIYKVLSERVLVLDGGMGSLIQQWGLTEEDFRGELFADWELPLLGCNDLLALTRPDVIADIHRRYLQAGADIISTDSFNANAVSLADYGLQEWAYRISKAAAETAAKAAGEFTRRDPSKPRYVGGSVGPTNRTASIAADMNNTALREITFAELAAAYGAQIEGLMDGGADIIQLETFFDTLNCKAAIFAAEQVFEKRGVRLPIIVSGTLTNSGRTLSGQTVEAFYASVAHAEPLAVGFNCSFGAKQLLPFIGRLSDVSRFPVSVYPNAGLPNVSGGYDETPAMMAADIEEYLRQGVVNIVGGCCGTTPEYIAEIAKVAERYPPRRLPPYSSRTVLSGLEPLVIDGNSNFINVGERANVAGSAKFARLIREGRYDEALAVARDQIEGGSPVIDICFDDGLIDGPAAMRRFLNMAAAEPDIARVPFMIDSSSWEVLEAGLQCVQGKSIVNSISLKEGEGEFLRRAKLIRRYGASAVVMLFDERGQADTYERKTEVAGRAYRLLTENGFPAEDIIFDPNVLAVATGIESHDIYGRDFIEACRWIRENLPHANISGGVSNLSFAFRGIDAVRRAMHSVFLYHAAKAGMNMGILNPAMIEPYDDIEPRLRELAEDVVMARRPDAAERLAAYAEKARSGRSGTAPAAAALWRGESVDKRIEYAMLKGVADHIEADAVEACQEKGGPLVVIDNVFMPAMEHVGRLFGEGKMFLPQVVKTARVMKKGVGALLPLMEAGKDSDRQGEKVLIATVKGDVHDIGKNIVSVVMSCNGYRINDLGVMVAADRIVDTAVEWGAAAIGLSALITPSLDEMIKVVRELERRGLRIPVIVGGATTSGVHTAVRIAPEYSGPVIHSRDASENTAILNKLFGPGRGEYLRELAAAQESLRRSYIVAREGNALRTLTEARANRYIRPPKSVAATAKTDIPVARTAPAKPDPSAAGIAPEPTGTGFTTKRTDVAVEGDDFWVNGVAGAPSGAVISTAETAAAPSGKSFAANETDASTPETHTPAAPDDNILANQKNTRSAATPNAAGHGDNPDREPQTYGRGSVPGGTGCPCCSLSPSASVAAPVPAHPGLTVFRNYPAEKVTDYIDWTFFFTSWGIRGHYPQLLDSPEKGGEARRLLADAKALLKRITDEKLLTLNGVAGLFHAYRAGDDIIVTDTDGTQVPLPMLRNQSASLSVNMSLADFIPEGGGYIGAFALSAGFGLKELAEKFRTEGDEYNAIMAKLLADRLTEAFAEALHREVRRDLWGYETGDEYSPAQIIAEKYEGRRMAFGYPASPDHSLKKEVFSLLNAVQNTGLKLNESYMIEPGESLCGLMFAGDDIHYFDVGHIGEDQIEDYARRRDITPEEVRRLLPRNV